MAFTYLVMEHDEDATDMLGTALQREEGNNLAAGAYLQNYLMSARMGARSLKLDVVSGAVKASSTVTVDEAVATNTVVINGVTLTADTDFSIGADDDATATNLAAEINSNASLSGIVTAAVSNTEVQEVSTITTVADVADSLDGKSFLIYDEVGSVGVWIDTDNSGTTIPTGANAAARALEVTTIITGDSADDVATKVATVINADSKFTASAVGSVITVTCVEPAALTNAADAAGGEATGFTFAEGTAGEDAIVTVSAARPGKMGNAITLSCTGGFAAGAARLAGGTDGTERNYGFGNAIKN